MASSDYGKQTRQEKKEAKARVKAAKKANKTPMSKDKLRKILMGSKDKRGLLATVGIYLVLVSIGFIFLYPLLRMLSTSLMSYSDLMNSSTMWIPSPLEWSNYGIAVKAMSFWDSLWKSILVALVPSLVQVAMCAVIGYGFAMFNFKGRMLLMGYMIFTFILPPALTTFETFEMYNTYGWVGNLGGFIFPALLGQGYKAPLFILICWQFFRQVPQSLTEAARIDGAGYFKQFFRISIPSATGALVTVFLFSFVWYWNDNYMTNLIINGRGRSATILTTLVLKLSKFSDNYGAQVSAGQGAASSAATENLSYRMAGTCLTILPLVLMYFVLQRQFVESIDRAGITGE